MAGTTTGFQIGNNARPATATSGLAQNQIPQDAIFGQFFDPLKSLTPFGQFGTELDNYNNAIQNFYNNVYSTQVRDKLNSDLSERGLQDSQLGARQMAEATRNFFAPANANVAQVSADLFGRLGTPFATAGANEQAFEQQLGFLNDPQHLQGLLSIIRQIGEQNARNQDFAQQLANRTAVQGGLAAQTVPNVNAGAVQAALGGGAAGRGSAVGGGGSAFSEEPFASDKTPKGEIIPAAVLDALFKDVPPVTGFNNQYNSVNYDYPYASQAENSLYNQIYGYNPYEASSSYTATPTPYDNMYTDTNPSYTSDAYTTGGGGGGWFF